jgi:hypothetical protein
MVIAIIVAFAWANQAARNKADQAQQEGALRNTLDVFHRRSNAVDSTALLIPITPLHDGHSKQIRRCGNELI